MCRQESLKFNGFFGASTWVSHNVQARITVLSSNVKEIITKKREWLYVLREIRDKVMPVFKGFQSISLDPDISAASDSNQVLHPTSSVQAGVQSCAYPPKKSLLSAKGASDIFPPPQQNASAYKAHSVTSFPPVLDPQHTFVNNEQDATHLASPFRMQKGGDSFTATDFLQDQSAQDVSSVTSFPPVLDPQHTFVNNEQDATHLASPFQMQKGGDNFTATDFLQDQSAQDVSSATSKGSLPDQQNTTVNNAHGVGLSVSLQPQNKQSTSFPSSTLLPQGIGSVQKASIQGKAIITALELLVNNPNIGEDWEKYWAERQITSCRTPTRGEKTPTEPCLTINPRLLLPSSDSYPVSPETVKMMMEASEDIEVSGNQPKPTPLASPIAPHSSSPPLPPPAQQPSAVVTEKPRLSGSPNTSSTSSTKSHSSNASETHDSQQSLPADSGLEDENQSASEEKMDVDDDANNEADVSKEEMSQFKTNLQRKQPVARSGDADGSDDIEDLGKI